MASGPIAAILAAQAPDGHWEKPGPGYATKYRGTVWQLIFLDQLGADPADARIRRACDYVLANTVSAKGGFGASGALNGPPPASHVIHCLNGNLLRALIGFGRLDDPRVQAAVEWEVQATTGHGVERWYASGTCGPGVCLCRKGQGPMCLGRRKGAVRPVPNSACTAIRKHRAGNRAGRGVPVEPRST